MQQGKLKLRTKIGYGMGDIFGGGSTTIINMYYLYFLTDIAGMNPALAATAILVSKLWDAVTDPFMGLISDNTRTRLGRRRPYFLAGIFLIFISFFLMWISPDFRTEGLTFAYYLGAYILFSTVYTMVWVPYNSIASELTDDYNERTNLSTFRIIFSNFAGILGAILPKDLFENTLFKGNSAKAFAVMAAVFGLFFALPYIVTFLTCRENDSFMTLPRKKIGNLKTFVYRNFALPFANRPFRYIALMYFFGFMAQDAVLGLAVYFLSYALKIGSMMTLLVPVYGGLIFTIPMANKVAHRIGKRKTYMLAASFWIAALIIVLFMKPGMPIYVMYIFGVIFGVGLAGVQVMVFAMFPDIPDADELLTGSRREGLYSGIFALLRKTGGAIILFFIGQFLDIAGYIQPINNIAQEQSDEFIRSITIVFTGVPVLLILLALFAAYRYPLTKQRLEEIKEILGKRRAGKPMENTTEEHELALKKIIRGE